MKIHENFFYKNRRTTTTQVIPRSLAADNNIYLTTS